MHVSSSKATPEHHVRELQKVSSSGFRVFLEGLKTTGQPHVVDILTENGRTEASHTSQWSRSGKDWWELHVSPTESTEHNV